MNQKGLYTLSGHVSSAEKVAVDLEHALDIVGVGWYNLRYCVVLAGFLIAAIVECIGYSFVLPASKCDLGMTDGQRGLVSSMPFIAIVLTSHAWGYLVDTRGRKLVLIASSLGVGCFTMLAAFMPDIISFAVVKFIGSLFMACPAAVPYAYLGEMLPRRHRDLALSITNAMQTLGSALVPLLAWGVLPLEFRVDFGLYDFRSWRLLAIVYSSFFVVFAILMCFGPESPKYLMSQGRNDEALEVLKQMYAGNKFGRKAEEFPVSSLKLVDYEKSNKSSFVSSLKQQTAPLFRPPLLKWMGLSGFLLFGIFATLNGLYVWVPDVLNRVLSSDVAGSRTACEVIEQRLNATNPFMVAVCDDSMGNNIFVINTVANVICAVLSLAASATVRLVGKKALLVATLVVTGCASLAVNFVRVELVLAALLCMLQLCAIGIGPINAYAVQIFPTELRGMALSLALMFGRLGSVFGVNVAGLLINSACSTTFFFFGGLLLLCALLSILLPGANR